VEQRHGREVIVVPLMVPDFVIERYIGYARGIMGGNFWVMCKTKQALKETGKKSLVAMHTVPGIVTSFDVCSAGSKPETIFPEIGPTTNHVYCPSLKDKLGKESLVPEGVNYIAELVFDGINIDVIKKALKAGIEAVLNIDGVTRVSAGNYGGKLGQYKVSFSELNINE
jgi:formylmethanofuran--tetrahydromethanopterin N-formyltransferase